MEVGVYMSGEDDDIDDLFAKVVGRQSSGIPRIAHTQKMAPIAQVSIAIRIKRSMTLSVPENVGGQTAVWRIGEKTDF